MDSQHLVRETVSFIRQLARGASAPRAWFPEYRSLEMYDSRKRLTFAEAPANEEGEGRLLSALARARLAHLALDDYFSALDPLLWEERSSWQRYQALPRTTRNDKIAAEITRILRIIRIATLHPQGRIELKEGIARLSCVFGRCALSLSITLAGLDILCAAAAYVLEAQSLPYSENYTEWMLAQYFSDLVGEIRKFADEDRILYQFQQEMYFNRHFRYDCDNPRVHADGEGYVFEISIAFRDRLRYPIDFYTVIDDRLHIVPVEALSQGGRLPRASLPKWQARLSDGLSLPHAFRERFARERVTAGLPMT